MIKKTDCTEEASRLVVKKQRERSQSKGPKKSTKTSNGNNDCYYYKQPAHMKKNCFKYKEMLKKKGDPGADGDSTSGNNQIKSV